MAFLSMNMRVWRWFLTTYKVDTVVSFYALLWLFCAFLERDFFLVFLFFSRCFFSFFLLLLRVGCMQAQAMYSDSWCLFVCRLRQELVGVFFSRRGRKTVYNNYLIWSLVCRTSLCKVFFFRNLNLTHYMHAPLQ